jgi:hypothetical protein
MSRLTSPILTASLTSSFITTTMKQVTVETTSTIRVYGSNTLNGGNGGGGGISFSDKIALGVGIGLGLPATIAALVTCCLQMGRMN